MADRTYLRERNNGPWLDSDLRVDPRWDESSLFKEEKNEEEGNNEG